MHTITSLNGVCQEGVYGDFCDGAFVRSYPLLQEDKEVLLIAIYYDELEVANPLGSKRGKHKLGMFTVLHYVQYLHKMFVKCYVL